MKRDDIAPLRKPRPTWLGIPLVLSLAVAWFGLMVIASGEFAGAVPVVLGVLVASSIGRVSVQFDRDRVRVRNVLRPTQFIRISDIDRVEMRSSWFYSLGSRTWFVDLVLKTGVRVRVHALSHVSSFPETSFGHRHPPRQLLYYIDATLATRYGLEIVSQ